MELLTWNETEYNFICVCWCACQLHRVYWQYQAFKFPCSFVCSISKYNMRLYLVRSSFKWNNIKTVPKKREGVQGKPHPSINSPLWLYKGNSKELWVTYLSHRDVCISKNSLRQNCIKHQDPHKICICIKIGRASVWWQTSNSPASIKLMWKWKMSKKKKPAIKTNASIVVGGNRRKINNITNFVCVCVFIYCMYIYLNKFDLKIQYHSIWFFLHLRLVSQLCVFFPQHEGPNLQQPFVEALLMIFSPRSPFWLTKVTLAPTNRRRPQWWHWPREPLFSLSIFPWKPPPVADSFNGT